MQILDGSERLQHAYLMNMKRVRSPCIVHCRQSSTSPRTYRHGIFWVCVRRAWEISVMASELTRRSLICSLIIVRRGSTWHKQERRCNCAAHADMALLAQCSFPTVGCACCNSITCCHHVQCRHDNSKRTPAFIFIGIWAQAIFNEL